ncbi:aldo/keto reductase [Novilysobacter defluvii]|uniref:Aldo/keto reductase n=1 Tax=Lysobacter defluvii IMMIB APB-9 = DSM 18482 TaxID=1385515 RepID=A0A0A0MAA9_9GAMM|nr:aldo/keto reductase [Lysobacter defluvii]KGO98121.1 aldo/keto reductase [Lysobacter defluvii IMMIB APB-9 = DSM 18482]
MSTRREFLLSASVAAAGLALAPLARAAADPLGVLGHVPSPGPGSLMTRAIPSSGERLPVIGAGTSGSYEVAPGSAEFEALKETIRIFFEGGGRVIDTAPNYSNAEQVLGALLEEGGWRDRCFLATKLAAGDRATMEAQWKASLRNLRTDRVELLQVHNMRAWEVGLPFARELKEQGLVKYIGFTHASNAEHARMEQLMREQKPDFIQVNYSVMAPDAARSLLPAARDQGVAVLINRAFNDGKLFARVADQPLPGWAPEVGVDSWAQMFLKFAISHPAVTAVIPATGKPHRQADNLKAGTGPLLDQAQRDELVRMFA